jgi:Sigma-70, region 4
MKGETYWFTRADHASTCFSTLTSAMASLESLPPDQRAVIQLVLQRGRSYDEIAELLSIDRDVVRQRAVAGLTALGPDTRVPDDKRALIADYLLGHATPDHEEQARTQLAESASARAWARVLSSELTPVAASPLPEIPAEQAAREPEPAKPVAATAEAEAPTAAETPSEAAPRSSRTGGAILLGAGALVALIIVGVVIVLVANSGGSSHHNTTAASVSTPAATTTATTAASTSGATPVAAVVLRSPLGAKKTVGYAQVVKQGGKTGLVLVAQGIPANTTHDAYAVWLYNSPSDAHILGFVNPGVKTDGKLQTAGLLPTNAAHFRQLLVTLETQAKPHGPGKIVLQGSFKLAQ